MILELDDVKVAYGARPVLRGVSLKIDRGEIQALIGPDGAGKTTTIDAALGLVPIWAGGVRLFGRDPRVEGDALRPLVGLLPQCNGFDEWMTAEQYLAYFAALYRLKPLDGEIASRIEQVGLEASTGYTIATFTRGMKQRLGLARAMIADPRLLILDEPTHGLEAHDRREVHDILHAYASEGAAILLCAQSLEDVERVSTKIGILVDGRTVADGKVGDILDLHAKKVSYRLRLAGPMPSTSADDPVPVTVRVQSGDCTYVEVDPAVPAEAVWRELVFRGWPITEIIRSGGGLEELYRELTSPCRAHDRSAA